MNPDVVAVKQTVYRTGVNSVLMEALIEAGMIVAMCGQIAIQTCSPGSRITDMPPSAC